MVPIDAGTQPRVRFLDPHPAIWYPLRFTPDGKALVHPIKQNRLENLWLQPLDGSPGRQITNFKTDLIVGLRWSPDGRNIGVLNRRIDADVVLLRESSTTITNVSRRRNPPSRGDSVGCRLPLASIHRFRFRARLGPPWSTEVSSLTDPTVQHYRSGFLKRYSPPPFQGCMIRGSNNGCCRRILA